MLPEVDHAGIYSALTGTQTDKVICEPVLRWWSFPLPGDGRGLSRDEGYGDRHGWRSWLRSVRQFSARTRAELAGVNTESAGVVELVALGGAALAFPAVNVVQHADVARREHAPASITGPPGHLQHVPGR